MTIELRTAAAVLRAPAKPGLAIAILVAASLSTATSAHADTRALAAAKKVLAPNQTIIAANFSALVGTPLWQSFVGKHPDAAAGIDKIKKTCGVDPLGAVDSIVLGVPDLSEGDKGVFVVALKGVAQKDVDACLTKIVKAEDKKDVKITTAGGITTYDSGKDPLDVRWLDKSTLAFAPAGKDQLVKLTAGGLAGNKASAAALKALRSDATVSIVYPQALPLDALKPGVQAQMAYGSATLAGGNIKLDIHLVLDADKTATDVATTASGQLAALQGPGAGAVPPQLASLVKSLAIKSAGKEIVVTAAMPDSDLQALMSMVGQ